MDADGTTDRGGQPLEIGNIGVPRDRIGSASPLPSIVSFDADPVNAGARDRAAARPAASALARSALPDQHRAPAHHCIGERGPVPMRDEHHGQGRRDRSDHRLQRRSGRQADRTRARAADQRGRAVSQRPPGERGDRVLRPADLRATIAKYKPAANTPSEAIQSSLRSIVSLSCDCISSGARVWQLGAQHVNS